MREDARVMLPAVGVDELHDCVCADDEAWAPTPRRFWNKRHQQRAKVHSCVMKTKSFQEDNKGGGGGNAPLAVIGLNYVRSAPLLSSSWCTSVDIGVDIAAMIHVSLRWCARCTSILVDFECNARGCSTVLYERSSRCNRVMHIWWPVFSFDADQMTAYVKQCHDVALPWTIDTEMRNFLSSQNRFLDRCWHPVLENACHVYPFKVNGRSRRLLRSYSLSASLSFKS